MIEFHIKKEIENFSEGPLFEYYQSAAKKKKNTAT